MKNKKNTKTAKFRCVILSLGGKTTKDFPSYKQAYEYGLDFVLNKDWTASFDVKEAKG